MESGRTKVRHAGEGGDERPLADHPADNQMADDEDFAEEGRIQSRHGSLFY